MSYKDRIEETLSYLTTPDTPSPLFEAIQYSVLAPAKRVRPLITLEVCSTLGGNLEPAYIPACCLELIHCSSLIHDDLPCMDDDDFRRGRPSLHQAYNEAIATLAGDTLLSLSFRHLATAPDLTDGQRVQLVAILAQAGISLGIGQMMDLSPSVYETRALHAEKTGALFKVAFEFGGVLAHNQDPLLGELGLEMGILFQYVDDLLDADCPDGDIAAQASVEKSSKWCREQLASLPGDTTSLEKLLNSIVQQITSHGTYAK